MNSNGVNNITFILFSFNEENRIEHVVRNLVPYGEVYLLDGGSTDKTQEIAERWGAHFVTRPVIKTAHVETAEMFEFAKSLIKTDWVYWGYVDNLLPKTLLDKMTEISRRDEFAYVYIPIYTYLWGETTVPMIKASYANFFKKDLMDFSNNRMHGVGKFIGSKNQILHLPNKLEYAIRHFSLYDVNKFVNGHLRYANAEAEEKLEIGKKFSLWYMFGSMGHYFYLFYRRGFRAGAKGFFVSLLYAFFRLMVFVRLFELERGITLESIEAEFAKEKKKIVSEVEGAGAKKV